MQKRKARDFLRNKKVVVLEPNHKVRHIIESVLFDLGVDKNNLFSFKKFSSAQQAIELYNPEIIITEFQIEESFGLDFMQLQLGYAKNPLDKLFFIVASNAADTAVADAAEEAVDCYLLKPFEQQVFYNYFLNAVMNKVEPTEYAISIIEAKKFISEAKYQDALSTLAIAKFLNNTPLLAHFYSGLAHEKMGDLNKALEEYQDGLQMNPLHFKCSVGEFMIYKIKKDKENAYRVLDRLASRFPLTPMLLKNAFILAITTYRYTEVEKFYRRYIDIPRKPKDLKHVVSQALLTSGKLLLEEKKTDQALDYFLKSAVINGRKSDILHNIIDTLIHHHMPKESENFLNMLKAEDLKNEIYLPLKLKISAESQSPEQIINEGKRLIQEGFADISTYEIVIRFAEKAKLSKLVENLSYQAIERYPNSRELFEKYL